MIVESGQEVPGFANGVYVNLEADFPRVVARVQASCTFVHESSMRMLMALS
jgi:hypothetical protein